MRSASLIVFQILHRQVQPPQFREWESAQSRQAFVQRPLQQRQDLFMRQHGDVDADGVGGDAVVILDLIFPYRESEGSRGLDPIGIPSHDDAPSGAG